MIWNGNRIFPEFLLKNSPITAYKYLPAALFSISCLLFLLSGWCRAGEANQVRIQLKWEHGFQFAGYYAAKEKGYYKEEGLDVRLLPRDPDRSSSRSVLEGEAEYGVADAGLILERIKGKPVVLLNQIFQTSPLVLLTLASSGIETPYDLPGKTVMIDMNGKGAASIISMLQITAGSMDRINIVPHSFNLEDLISGRVDAYSAYLTDQPHLLKTRGIQYNILNPVNYGIDFYGDNFFTTEDEIRRHPDRVEKMIRATLKGWKYAADNPDGIIDLILEKYRPRASRAHLDHEARLTLSVIRADQISMGSVSARRYEKIMDTYAKTGMAGPEADFRGFLYKQDHRKGRPVAPPISPPPEVQVPILQTGLIIILTMTAILLLFRVLDRSQDTPVTIPFAGPAGRRIPVLFTSFLVGLAVLLAWWTLDIMGKKIKKSTVASLQTIVSSTHEAIIQWAEYRKKEMADIASDPDLIEAVTMRTQGRQNGNNQVSLIHISLLGRMGQTGETYTFDRNGRILTTNLRHQEASAGTGRLPPHMAAHALKGKTGYNAEGKLNYRGIPVISAWIWDDALNIGIAAELSTAEAMAPYYTARMALAVILSVCITVSIGFALLAVVLSSRAARALQSAHDQLEKRVDERTTALAEAKKEAEKATRAKSIFLANISHEIRTPLNVILGYAQLMRHDTALSPAQKENLNIMNRSGNHLLELINTLLDISKAEADRLSIRANTFDPRTMLADLLEMFHVKAAKKGLSLDLRFDPGEEGLVHQDESKIRQVLINLLNNAIQSTNQGGITIGFACNKQGTRMNGQMPLNLEFTVEDTGTGIPENEQDLIFEVFEQARVNREKRRGTGLGLAISRKYAREMGGDLILVRSRPGKGATFRFTVTAGKGDPGLIKSQIRFLPVDRLAPGQPEVRVLVVDDRYLNRDMISQMLTRVGFIVHTAKGGAEACEKFETLRPDCILMDIRMPVIDGIKTAREIRSLPGGRQAVIIAVSASAIMEDRQTLRQKNNPTDAFLKKPIEEEVLFETLKQQLDLKFIYRNARKKILPDRGPEPFKPEEISGLPPALGQEIHNAAKIGDITKLENLARDLEKADASLARTFHSHLKNFDINTILRNFSSWERPNATR